MMPSQASGSGTVPPKILISFPILHSCDCPAAIVPVVDVVPPNELMQSPSKTDLLSIKEAPSSN
jgi:hypothetical protein